MQKQKKLTAEEAVFQAITTKYLGPTNHRGSRIKATTESGLSRTIPHDSAANNERNHRIAALALASQLDWHGHLVGGATKTGYVWVFSSSNGVAS